MLYILSRHAPSRRVHLTIAHDGVRSGNVQYSISASSHSSSPIFVIVHPYRTQYFITTRSLSLIQTPYPPQWSRERARFMRCSHIWSLILVISRYHIQFHHMFHSLTLSPTHHPPRWRQERERSIHRSLFIVLTQEFSVFYHDPIPSRYLIISHDGDGSEGRPIFFPRVESLIIVHPHHSL